MSNVGSAESAGGRLGAALSVPRGGVVSLGPSGPFLATTLAQARHVLTDLKTFDFPGDVSRSGNLEASRADTRSGHSIFAPLTPDRVACGMETFSREWVAALAEHHRMAPDDPFEAMTLLRRPVARSTTAAVLTHAHESERLAISELALHWIDALAPVISARRSPRPWSRARRTERRTRLALEDALADLPGLGRPASHVATMLAAGIQVPIAAGAWLLAWLADYPGAVDPQHAVWETLRLTPPTWVTARITTEPVELDGTKVPAGRVVLVSPLLLGRLSELVPGDPAHLTLFDPDRWHDTAQRPGAWLPFGAGPHACPGRILGMAQLVHLAEWSTRNDLSLSGTVAIDQSRGIAPLPCRVRVIPDQEPRP